MIKLRLKRFGRKGLPHFRIVAIQEHTKRDGQAIEDLGHYSPLSKEISLKKERIEYWISVGAQPTATVSSILIKEKVIAAPKFKRKFNDSKKRKATERDAAKAEKANSKKEEVKEEKTEEAAA